MKISVRYHHYFWAFGFLYYLVCPFLFVKYIVFGTSYEFPGGDLFKSFYTDSIDYKYITIICSYFLAFYAGSYFVMLFPRKKIVENRYQNRYPVHFQWLTLLLVVFLFLQYPIFRVENVYDPIIGFVATASLLFTFFILYNLSIGLTLLKMKWSLAWLLFLFFFLLNSGTRMYFLIPAIMFLIYFKEKKHISLTKIFLLILGLGLLLLFVGVYRLGMSDYRLMLYIFIAEPVYTWISACSMFGLNPDFHMFMFPSDFLASFINFIPTFIFPDKVQFYGQIPLNYEAPLGATSILVSLIGNFGVIGGAMFIFCVGMFSSFLYLKSWDKFYYVYYIAYTSILPFQFFRDGFSILNKNVFFTFLIFPLLIVFFSNFYKKYICGKKPSSQL